jgi:uncharacterized protein (DUF2384 family)
MDISKLSKRQAEILEKLEKNIGSAELFEMWMSTPNAMFKHKTPYDVLLSGNFDYFDTYLSTN